MKLLTKIFGTRNDRIIKELQPTLQKINELEHKIAKMEDSDFPKITADFRKRFDSGETLDDMLPEALPILVVCISLVTLYYNMLYMIWFDLLLFIVGNRSV